MEERFEALLVDDTPSATEQAAEILENEGLNVRTASRDKDGVALLREKPAHLIVAGLNPPQVGGLKVARQAKALNRDAAILIITRSPSLESAVEALREGAYDYLVSPWSEQVLREALQRGLAKVREAQRRVESETAVQSLLRSIERAKREWESTADSLPDLICLVDDQGRVLRANRTVEAWNLSRVVDAPGQTLHDLLHPRCAEQSSCYLDAFWEKAREKSRQYQSEQREVYDQTLKRHLQVRAHPCRNEEREAAAGSTVIIVSDITERRRAEEAEVQLLRLKEEFLDRVSHELRTPLFSIQGFVNLMLNDRVQNASVQREFLSRIADQANRLGSLVESLLDVSGLEKGQLELVKRSASVQRIAGRVVQRLAEQAREKSISLASHMGPSLPVVEADVDRIEQVLTNLVDNALKFTPDGGQVLIEGEVDKEALVVHVSDNGIGIPPDAKPYLFSTFYQVDGSTTRRVGGVGLGLYISRLILEAHGGWIWAESELDKGSTFSFALPLPGNGR